MTQFKNTAQLTRVQVNQPSRAERLRRQEESKIVMLTKNLVETNKQDDAPLVEEETKDSFVIVDNTYLDSVSEIHPLSNVSDFTRVNPMTA